MKFVLDNSVTMRWLFGDGSHEDREYSLHVLEHMKNGQAGALVPGLWALEMANLMARGEARSILDEARSSEFLSLLQRMDVTEDSRTFSQAFSHTLHLSRRYSLSAYDAAYLELALRLGLPLATLDRELREAQRHAGIPLF